MGKSRVAGLILICLGVLVVLGALLPDDGKPQGPARGAHDTLAGMALGFLVTGIGLTLFVVAVYNTLVAASVLCGNTWANIDVLLKRRHDLIDNLVSIVRAYAHHEKSTFSEVTAMRSRADAAGTIREKATAEQGIQGLLSRLMAIAESYPALKADANFRDLSGRLGDTEDGIASSREAYNQAVANLNVLVRRFPDLLIASLFRFGRREFFEIDARHRLPPVVTSAMSPPGPSRPQ